jgi:hypothetical protein
MQAHWIVNGDKCSRPFFCTLKSMSVSTATEEVFDAHNRVVSTWEEIASAAVAHYTNILGTTKGQDNHAIQKILEAQYATISQVDRERIDVPFTMDELHQAAKALGRNKCPGKAGAPVEFFLCNWTMAGPTLHKALLEGIESTRLADIFTEGFLVLLHKQGDPRLFINKRPLTMLNAIYKLQQNPIK